MILCSPEPASARRLSDIDRAATLRAYCLARLEEHLGPLTERKLECRKVGCAASGSTAPATASST